MAEPVVTSSGESPHRAATAPSPAIELDGVWFAYSDAVVLSDVWLAIAAGERVALLGRNGAGKTTLTKLPVALLHPARGAVRVAGRDTAGRTPEAMADVVAYVFQHPDHQLFARTVWDEVAFAPRRLGVPTDEIERRVRAALDAIGLSPRSREHPYDLPPWGRKLVTLAAALAQAPRALVLDEPTQGLDHTGIARVGDVLKQARDEGVATLCVTHDLSFVTDAFDRAVVLDGGRVVFDGPPVALVRHPRVGDFGLEAPPIARLSVELNLPGTPVAFWEVADAVSRRCFGRS
jgi:energy-coupling factor transport system ATP-binding protein